MGFDSPEKRGRWKGLYTGDYEPYKRLSRNGSFQSAFCFYQWAMTNGYRKGLTSDRIDNSKGYSPDNCRWVTIKEQSNNRRSNRNITYKGQTKTLMQWSEELGMNFFTLRDRLDSGWSIEKAFTRPVKRKQKKED